MPSKRWVSMTEGMAKLDAGAHGDLGRQRLETIEMDDHDVAQAQPHDDGALRLRVPGEHVAIAENDAAIERDRHLAAAGRALAKAVLLRFPLVERQHVDARSREAREPFRIAA